MADQHAQIQQQQQQGQQAGQTPTQSWTLFVGQIPNDVNEDTLKQLFSAYGLVTESKILMDKIQNKPKGCGFITYADKHGADTAIATLHDTFKLPGSARALIVRYSTKQLATDKSDPGPFKLYISNLSRQTTEEEVRAMFSAYGTLVDDVVVLKDPATGASRGVAFVRYNSRSEAMHAIQALNEQIRDKDAPHLMQVKFAHTASEKKMLLHRQLTGQSHPALHGAAGMHGQAGGNMPAAMGGYYPAGYNPAYGNYNPYMGGAHGPASYPSQYGAMGGAHGGNNAQRHSVTKGPDGANLFVYGIPESYNDQDLSGLFANFGNVINAKVYRDLSTGKSKGFGFVSFDQVGPAVAACGAMDGYLIAGKKMTVKPKTDNGPPQQQGGGHPQHHHAGQPQQHHGQRQQHQQHQQQQHIQQQHNHAGQPQHYHSAQQHHGQPQGNGQQVQSVQSPQGQQQQMARNGQQQQQQYQQAY